jgi:hypothetical protein
MTAVPFGGFDLASSGMVYRYSDGVEHFRHAPSFPSLCSVGGQSHEQCSSYYTQGLYRQHTNSSAFHDFSITSGRVFPVSSSGYYAVCVSASDKIAGSFLQDGVLLLRFQMRGTNQQCAISSKSSAVNNSISSRTKTHVSSVFLSIDDRDRVPFAAGKSITLTFNTMTALEPGEEITLSYPKHFISAGYPTVIDTAGLYVKYFSTSQITIRAVRLLDAGIQIITLSGVTFGPPTSGSATGITVSTSKDFQSAGSPSGSLGGQVTGVSFTIAAADRVPLATGKSVTFAFTIATALSSGDQITLRYPDNFISSSGSTSVVCFGFRV